MNHNSIQDSTRRARIWWWLALLLIAGLYAVWTPAEGLGQLGRDGPRYMMMADHYALFGKPDPVYAETATSSQLPPLYPMVLAWTGSADNLQRAHRVTALCLLLALAAYTAWLRRAGLSLESCALLMLLVAALPGSWLTDLLIQSEYLYLFLSLLALGLMAAYRDTPRPELLYAAALAVGAASLSRTVGICLLAPLLLSFRHGPWRNIAAAMALALFPALSWHFLHRSAGSYDSQLLSIYGSHPWQALQAQLAQELPALRKGFAENLLNGQPLGPVADALALLCLGGALVRALRLESDGVYLAAYAGVLLIWPYPEEAPRLIWAVLPLLLAQPLLLIGSAGKALRGGVPRHAAPAVLSALVLPAALIALSQLAERWWSAPYSGIPHARIMESWYGRDLAYASESLASENAFIDAMQLIASEVPEDDCVISIRPDVVNYYSHRRSKGPPLNSIPDPQFEAMLRRSGCHYIFAMAFRDTIFRQPLHPLQRLSKGIEMVYASAIPDANGGPAHILCALVRLLPEKPAAAAGRQPPP